MMFKVHGKVIVEETQVGIENLIVAIFDVDCQKWQKKLSASQRLGSTITEKNGFFSFEFNLDSFIQADKTGRPDLALCIFAPDRNTSDTDPTGLSYEERLLHISQCPLYEAGNTEAFVINIKSKILKKHRLAYVPEEFPEPELHTDKISDIENFQNIVAAEEKQSQEWAKVLKPIIEKRKVLRVEAQDVINKVASP